MRFLRQCEYVRSNSLDIRILQACCLLIRVFGKHYNNSRVKALNSVCVVGCNAVACIEAVSICLALGLELIDCFQDSDFSSFRRNKCTIFSRLFDNLVGIDLLSLHKNKVKYIKPVITTKISSFPVIQLGIGNR